MWTESFQMFKLVLEKAEEPETKFPTSDESSKKQESSRKTSTALLTMPKPLTVWITTNWKSVKEMGISEHLTCFLRNLYASQEATVEPDMEQPTGSKFQKEYIKAVYCLFNLYAEYIMQNAGLDEAQAEIKTARRNINNLNR